ncbi:hypothetical protein OUZ56_021365 [Daphnia magna]|uniref:Uncharacterized protein n=1 Tax=Daphnia magna TaxID=35525 RepID=A0ABQ9ZIL1_9CRUS|nr:hypothetical protein OUZ56_021365 [Daphnia magna]
MGKPNRKRDSLKSINKELRKERSAVLRRRNLSEGIPSLNLPVSPTAASPIPSSCPPLNADDTWIVIFRKEIDGTTVKMKFPKFHENRVGGLITINGENSAVNEPAYSKKDHSFYQVFYNTDKFLKITQRLKEWNIH